MVKKTKIGCPKNVWIQMKYLIKMINN